MIFRRSLEENIKTLKPLILAHYFDAVDLRVAKNNNGDIVGFICVPDGNIEMLFIDPGVRGQGIGALLTHNAIQNQQASKVDVNEQNPQALGFYQHIGFNVIGRSEKDGQGKPYPILHLSL